MSLRDEYAALERDDWKGVCEYMRTLTPETLTSLQEYSDAALAVLIDWLLANQSETQHQQNRDDFAACVEKHRRERAIAEDRQTNTIPDDFDPEEYLRKLRGA